VLCGILYFNAVVREAGNRNAGECIAKRDSPGRELSVHTPLLYYSRLHVHVGVVAFESDVAYLYILACPQ